MNNATKLFQIRIAQLSDLDALVDFENSCFTSDKMSRRSLRQALTNNLILMTETQQKQLIAVATLFFRKNTPAARLYSIGVTDQWRGQGVALDLLIKTEQHARQRGCSELKLEVRKDNHRAIQFYKKNAYAVFASYENFYEDGTAAWRMKKNLL